MIDGAGGDIVPRPLKNIRLVVNAVPVHVHLTVEIGYLKVGVFPGPDRGAAGAQKEIAEMKQCARQKRGGNKPRRAAARLFVMNASPFPVWDRAGGPALPRVSAAFAKIQCSTDGGAVQAEGGRRAGLSGDRFGTI